MTFDEAFTASLFHKFVYHENMNVFTGLEVKHHNGLHETKKVEIHVGGNEAAWIDFNWNIILKNLSRLTDAYLQSAINECRQEVDKGYDNYLVNSDEYESWVNLLDTLQAEVKLRGEQNAAKSENA